MTPIKIPFLKNRNSILQGNIGKTIFVVVERITVVKIVKSCQYGGFGSDIEFVSQIYIVFLPGGGHDIGRKQGRIRRVFGDHVDEATHCLRAVQRGGGTFHHLNTLHHRHRDARKTINRRKATDNGHSINQNHRIRPF